MARAGRKARADGRAVAKMLPAKAEAVPVETGREVATVAVDAGALLASAVQNKLPMEQLRELMAMRRELEAEWAKKEFFRAMAEFQAECPVIVKEAIVWNKKDNPRDPEEEKTERFRFAPIEDIVRVAQPIMEKHGFSATDDSDIKDGWVAIKCFVHHAAGHTEMTTFRCPIDENKYMSAPQRILSSTSFARRVAFNLAMGIVCGGEDEERAHEGEEHPTIQEPKAKGEPAKESAKEASDMAKAEADLAAAGKKLDAALGKPFTPAEQAAMRMETAKAEATAVYKEAVNSNKTLKRPFTPDELSAMVKAAVAARDAGDIEKLRSLAIDWTVDLDNRRKGE